MKKVALLILATVVLTMMAMSCVWAGDDVNPYVVVKPPIVLDK